MSAKSAQILKDPSSKNKAYQTAAECGERVCTQTKKQISVHKGGAVGMSSLSALEETSVLCRTESDKKERIKSQHM